MFLAKALFCSVLAAQCWPLEGKAPSANLETCQLVISETESKLKAMAKKGHPRIPSDIKLESSTCVEQK